jgi:small subunit ribosomal protein S16
VVKLRLRRIGKKKQPVYKFVAADSRAARNGKFIESIGQYNPRVEPMVIDVNEPRLFHWLKSGAQPTDTVRSLLQRKGLWLKWDLVRRGADETTIASELEKWNLLQSEKLRRESEKKDRRRAARKSKAATSEPVAAAPPTSAAPEPEAAPAS